MNSSFDLGHPGLNRMQRSAQALETNAVIVPIAAATGRCWPAKSWTFVPGRADFSIGPAIVPKSGEDPIALMSRVEKWIEDEMRVIDADAYID